MPDIKIKFHRNRMYWVSKITRALNLQSKPSLPDRFSGAGAREDIRGILAENTVVGGDASVVDQLILNGEIFYYRRGQKIIEKGGLDNHVFFLLAGSVDIVFKSHLGSIRESPNQVGEMAAIRPGAARSAAVCARTGEVAALRVSGATFHHIYSTDPNFKQRLDVEIETRFRERIAAGHVAKQNSSILWLKISFASSLFVLLMTWIAAAFFSLPQTSQIMVAFGAGVFSFLAILLLDPAYFWKRCFWTAFVAMIGTLWFGRYVSVEAGDGFKVTLGSDAFGGSGADTIIQIFPFLFTMLICAVRDHAISRNA